MTHTRRFVSNLALSELSRSSCPMHILDVAGGTGDIAFRCIEELSRWSTVSVLQPRLSHRVTICDINQSMLDIGKRRATSLGYLSPQSPVQPSFLCADAQSLAMIPDASVDLYTIAFGLRNVTDKKVQCNSLKIVVLLALQLSGLPGMNSTGSAGRGASSVATGRTVHVPRVQPRRAVHAIAAV